MIAGLRSANLLDGWRNRPPGDREALADALVKLSLIAHALRYELSEIDINPLVVHPRGASAVDAMVRFRS